MTAAKDNGVHLGSVIRRLEIHLASHGKKQLTTGITAELEKLLDPKKTGLGTYAPLDAFAKIAREYEGKTVAAEEIRSYGREIEQYLPNTQSRKRKVYGTD